MGSGKRSGPAPAPPPPAAPPPPPKQVEAREVIQKRTGGANPNQKRAASGSVRNSGGAQGLITSATARALKSLTGQ